MSAGYTPGPWLAASAPSSIVGWPIVAAKGRAVASASWMPQPSHISDREYQAFQNEVAANARLIGAAPDLLEALSAVSVIRPANWGDDDDPDQVAAWRMVDAAIAKATGAA